MRDKEPNPGHLAIAQCEARLRDQGRRVVVITQNIDELHRKAGTKNLLEIHGEETKTLRHSLSTLLDTCPSPKCCDTSLGDTALPKSTQTVGNKGHLAHRHSSFVSCNLVVGEWTQTNSVNTPGFS